MIKQIFDLFSKNAQSADNLDQSQREAIIDLLVLCMYSDNHIAAAESTWIKRTAESFSWESVTPLENYIQEAITRVRSAKRDSELRKGFITYASERLQTSMAKSQAAEWCTELFESDAEFAEEEKTVNEEIRSILLDF